jgi:hypothetical protein
MDDYQRLNQGVRQLPDGRLYRTRTRDGAVVPWPEELRAPDPMMEPVEVESQGKPGTTYRSVKFFQSFQGGL